MTTARIRERLEAAESVAPSPSCWGLDDVRELLALADLAEAIQHDRTCTPKVRDVEPELVRHLEVRT